MDCVKEWECSKILTKTTDGSTLTRSTDPDSQQIDGKLHDFIQHTLLFNIS